MTTTGSRVVCIAGGGSWGTALAHIAAQNGHRTTIFLRDGSVCAAINERHENPKYLPGCTLAPSLAASMDPSVLDCDILVLAIPFQHQRGFLKAHAAFLRPGVLIVNVAKGIELSTMMTGTQVVAEALSGLEYGYAVLSGPSFAKEVVENRPTAVVVASTSRELSRIVQETMSGKLFRCYASEDVLGVEIGGAVKNVIAIAAGICDGMGIGTNGRAALMTRGIAEISRLGVALGAAPLTFMGLSGLGDLMLTATGDLSRNRRLGLAIGKGMSLEQATATAGSVTEGVKTAAAVRDLSSRCGVDVPITTLVCDVLEGRLRPSEAVVLLMERQLRTE